ncbi:MAG: ABC transporter ATP-binding protein [Candidatus Melainabacteria bacterium]|nr:ABC transporter ATP-binding protein [Candidatus Melainabacteria bacterium]
MSEAPSIKVSQLTKVFGKRTVVDHLDLEVHPGELYALLGDNGAGKTTTINMLTTLLKPTAGRFSISGFDGISDPEKAKSKFAVVSQEVALYQELTAFENLMFVSRLYGLPREGAVARIEQHLSQWDLLSRRNDFVGDFSGGMQRKLSIAGALLRSPRVLFLDEPTVGLDPGSRQHIWEILTGLKHEGVTIFLTTHYLEEAELLADRLGIIVRGKLIAEGTIDELRGRLNHMKSICVRMARRPSADELDSSLSSLRNFAFGEVSYDELRNTFSIALISEKHLSETLRAVTDWIESEHIPVTGVSTSEPSLEEIYLALSHENIRLPREEPASALPVSKET